MLGTTQSKSKSSTIDTIVEFASQAIKDLTRSISLFNRSIPIYNSEYNLELSQISLNGLEN